MPLKNRTTSPPGGFPYDQKRADGTIIRIGGVNWGFNQTVNMIREYRLGNNLLPTDLASIGAELDQFTCERLGFDEQWVESKKNSASWPALQQSPSHVLRRAAKLVAGANILKDWLGSGGLPVSQELAQSRADVCLKCQENQEGHFVAKLTTAIASAIHSQRREKLQMGLKVNGEENLHTCKVCLCHLPLLCWTPADVLAERTDAQSLEEYPAACWKANEIRSLNAAQT